MAVKKSFKTIKIFYSFIARKRLLFVLFLLITISSSVFASVVPYFYKMFVDGLQNFEYSKLLNVLVLLLIVNFVTLITHMLSFFIGDKLSFDGSIAARRKIFEHVQNLDFAFHANKSTGFLISAFKRGDGSFWGIFHVIHHRFLDVLVSFIIMVYFFSNIDSRITLIVLASFALSLYLTKILIKINIRARRLHNDEEDKVSAIIVDNMINFETVKLFSQEKKEIKRLKDAFVPWLSTGWKYVNTFRLIDGGIGTLVNLSMFLIFYIGLNLSSKNLLSVGDFVLILGFVNSIYPKLFDLVYGFREIGKNFADIEKYFGLLDYTIEVKDPDNPITLFNMKGEIEFKDVTFAYSKRSSRAVNGINLRIRQGQSVALVGKSGSGKTTLITLLMRFYDCEKGKISLDGVDIKDITKSHLRSFMGVVPQEPILFDNTISYNIAYGREKITKAEIIAAAKIANMHKFITTLPDGYGTNVGERGIKLSGGQKQRLAIARMILSDPEIIIFDEATSQLDSENEQLIQSALWKAVKDKTTIIIAHRLATAMRADKIVVMESGKIKEVGSHQELLLNKDGLYKHFWDLQTESV